MFRYVAFVWNIGSPSASEAARSLSATLHATSPHWQTAMSAAGVKVFARGIRPGSSEVCHLSNQAGVVLGKLFRRSPGGESVSAPALLDEAESARALASRGRHLVDRYWGRYVAVLRDATSGSVCVLRDPSAVLPCMWAELAGVHVFFSCVEDLLSLPCGRFSIDWRYVTGALASRGLQLNSTGVEQISQLLGGESVELRGDISRRFHWNPLLIADSEPLENPARAAAELRRCARDCVQAWAACYPGIVHTLSGGLDSSIVMACLQDAPSRPRITCVNYHSPGSDGDERVFARLVAQRAARELLELQRDTDVSFEPLLHAAPVSAPFSAVLYHLENARAEAVLAAERGATAIFSGNAGDQLFYQARGDLAAGDYIQRRGIGSGALDVSLGAARMDGTSVWSVLSGGIARGLLGRRWSAAVDAGRHSALMSAEAIAAVRSDVKLLHPLFRAGGRYPSGKLFHAHALLFAPGMSNPLGRPDDPELVAPLYSQPLIELVLRIPTYVLSSGGWDRALARRAFRHELPIEVATRQTKGGLEEHAKAVLQRNMALVRELLLDGVLVRQGILDPRKVRAALSVAPTRAGGGVAEIYDSFCAEAWARGWRESRPLRNAA